jgi:hypothetical protein
VARESESEPGTQPAWLAVTITVLVLLTVVGAYLTSLRLVLETSPAATPNEHDTIYFGLHGAALMVATITGGIVGFLQGRRAFAISILFLAVILVTMFAAQLITFELACSGHNDIIRHWQC